MRITEIEIKNFKAFYGTYRIDLRKRGKNLLIYGENGSGKSSLYFALKLFLESGEAAIKKFCEKENLQVRYRENPKELQSNDFWEPIKKGGVRRWYTLFRPEPH